MSNNEGFILFGNLLNEGEIIIYKHLNSLLSSCKVYQWFNGKISACHAGAPGSIPGWCSHRNYMFCSLYIIECPVLSKNEQIIGNKTLLVVICHWKIYLFVKKRILLVRQRKRNQISCHCYKNRIRQMKAIIDVMMKSKER